MPYGDSSNVTSSDPLPISNCFIYGVDIVLEVRLLQLLFCCRTLESRSDWSESTTSEARSISSVNHIFDFSLLPRPPAQDTTSKCHPIQPPQTPLSLLRLLIMTARQQQYASHIQPYSILSYQLYNSSKILLYVQRSVDTCIHSFRILLLFMVSLG